MSFHENNVSFKEPTVYRRVLLSIDQVVCLCFPQIYSDYAKKCLGLMEVLVMPGLKKYLTTLNGFLQVVTMLLHTDSSRVTARYSFFKTFSFPGWVVYYSFLGLVFQGAEVRERLECVYLMR